MEFTPGRMLRANELAGHQDIENGDWKFVSVDADDGRYVVPKGSWEIAGVRRANGT